MHIVHTKACYDAQQECLRPVVVLKHKHVKVRVRDSVIVLVLKLLHYSCGNLDDKSGVRVTTDKSLKTGTLYNNQENLKFGKLLYQGVIGGFIKKT